MYTQNFLANPPTPPPPPPPPPPPHHHHHHHQIHYQWCIQGGLDARKPVCVPKLIPRIKAKRTQEKFIQILKFSHTLLSKYNIQRSWNYRPYSTNYNHLTHTVWKVSAFALLLVRIFRNSDWIRRDTPYPQYLL